MTAPARPPLALASDEPPPYGAPSHRQPPFSEDAERAVLGAILADQRAFLVAVEQLTPESFYREAHRKIFRAIVRMAECGHAIDAITVCQALEDAGDLKAAGGKEYIGLSLIDPSIIPGNVAHYASIVREKAERRQLIERLERAREEAWTSDIAVRDIARELQSHISPIAIDTGSAQGFVHVKDDIWEVMQEIETLAHGGISLRMVPTGYHEIDTKIAGGIERGELCVLAGVPGGCKTAAAANMAMNLALSDPPMGALFVSAEMTRKKLIKRLLARAARVQFKAIRSGELNDADWARLARGAGVLSTLPFRIDQTPLPDIEQVLAKCRERKSAEPSIGIVVVDFIQLVQKQQALRGEKDANRSAELTAITYKLKGLAKELDIAVIATSQVDASGIEKREQKRPNPGDARWSQGMREGADLFALTFRPKQYQHSLTDDTLEFNFAKARDSEPFTAVLNWDGALMTLSSRTPKPLLPAQPHPGLDL